MRILINIIGSRKSELPGQENTGRKLDQIIRRYKTNCQAVEGNIMNSLFMKETKKSLGFKVNYKELKQN